MVKKNVIAETTAAPLMTVFVHSQTHEGPAHRERAKKEIPPLHQKKIKRNHRQEAIRFRDTLFADQPKGQQ
jgi:hypothetical protein